MIEFERTLDYDLVSMIFTHPRLYPHLADDFYPAPHNFMPIQSEGIFYMLAKEAGEILGIVSTHPINAITYEVHHFLLPKCWGPKATEIGASFEAWLWLYTPAMKAVGFTPSCNTLALRYARKAGMVEAGRIRQCYQKAFKLYDIIIFEKSRPGMAIEESEAA